MIIDNVLVYTEDKEFVKDLPAILHKDLLKILGIE